MYFTSDYDISSLLAIFMEQESALLLIKMFLEYSD